MLKRCQIWEPKGATSRTLYHDESPLHLPVVPPVRQVGRDGEKNVGPRPSRTDPFHLSSYFHKLKNHRLKHRHVEIIFSTIVVRIRANQITLRYAHLLDQQDSRMSRAVTEISSQTNTQCFHQYILVFI